MGKHLNQFQLAKIVAWRNQKHSVSFGEIGKKLKRDSSVIRKAYYLVKERKSPARKTGSGRRRNTTPREDKRIKFYVRKNPFATNKEMRDNLNLASSPYRVGQRCIELGWDSYYTIAKPFISEEFALTHVNDQISKWKKILFDDEGMFYHRFHQKRRVRRFRGERYIINMVQGTVKHPPHVMIFCSLCYDGLGTFAEVRGTMDRCEYPRLLQHYAIPSYNNLIGHDGYFLQDNDSKHKSNYCTNYLRRQEFSLIDFPAQSPDLNVIENFWDHLEFVHKERKCNSAQQVMDLLAITKQNFHAYYLHRLVDSMPRRLRAVIKAKEGPTKY